MAKSSECALSGDGGALSRSANRHCCEQYALPLCTWRSQCKQLSLNIDLCLVAVFDCAFPLANPFEFSRDRGPFGVVRVGCGHRGFLYASHLTHVVHLLASLRFASPKKEETIFGCCTDQAKLVLVAAWQRACVRLDESQAAVPKTSKPPHEKTLCALLRRENSQYRKREGV